MRENAGAIFLFSAMLLTILFLSLQMTGCTLMDTEDRFEDNWKMEVVGTTQECRILITKEKETTVTDDSFEVSQPNRQTGYQ